MLSYMTKLCISKGVVEEFINFLRPPQSLINKR